MCHGHAGLAVSDKLKGNISSVQNTRVVCDRKKRANAQGLLVVLSSEVATEGAAGTTVSQHGHNT